MFHLDRSHNEPGREQRLATTTPTSRSTEWGRDAWMKFVASELKQAGFTDAVAYNVPGTDNRRFELLGMDSPGEYVFEFDRRRLGRWTVDDLGRDVVWWIRRSAILYRGQLKGVA